MDKRKVALITGGARGIGYGIAKALAQDGCDLVIGDIQDQWKVQEPMNRLRDLGTRVLYCQADVSSAEARQAMILEIQRQYGRLNILVNNAGVAPLQRADILEATEESFDRLMSINLKGPYFLTQAVARWMIDQKKKETVNWACIINISSISATVASPTRGDYCISKAGVSMATMLWASRLGEFDIPVYEIRPGVIKTEMTAPVQAKYDKLISEGLMLQSRWGQPDDIGKAVAGLARGDFPYSTGQVIMVDGGMTVQRL